MGPMLCRQPEYTSSKSMRVAHARDQRRNGRDHGYHNDGHDQHIVHIIT